MRLRSVVLPEPRKPVRMMTDALARDWLRSGVMDQRWVRARARARTWRHLPSVDDRRLHLADRLAVLHLHVAAHDGVDRHALDLPAAPWRRVVLAVQLVRVDRSFLVHVDDGEVAVRAEADRALLGILLPPLGDVL